MLRSHSFIFDGQSSEDYGVMLYFIDDDSQIRELELGTNVSIVEDRPTKRLTPIHYGTNINSSLSFPIVFGSTTYLSDYEVDAIISWLTGHNQYKFLEYVDHDHYVRYKCFINEMSTVYIDGLPTAFKATVVCDGQFAYEYPTQYEYNITEIPMDISLFNKSSYNGYYYPKLDIYFDDDCSSISIVNKSDKDRTTKIDYFDRIQVDDNAIEQTYDTSLNNEFSQTSNILQNFTWKDKQLPVGSYNDIVFHNGTYVALPKNSNIAQVSTNGGDDWSPVELPVSGTFIGCSGADGFVAIQTESVSNVALHSDTGFDWIKIPEGTTLPVTQNWTSICYAKLGSFSDGYFIAVGNSSVAAVSLTGLDWRSLDVSLPGNNWSSVAYGDGKAIAISTSSKTVAYCTSVTNWKVANLPATANWTDIAYGNNGWCLICNSSSTNPQNPIFATSKDGITWEKGTMPIGSWDSLEYYDGAYLAISGMTYALSLDNENWIVNSYNKPIIALSSNSERIIGITNNSILFASLIDAVAGKFSIQVSAEKEIGNIVITGLIANSDNVDDDYVSNGEKELYIQNKDETVDYGFVTMTQDTRSGLGVEGVKLHAMWDDVNGVVMVDYLCDPNHTSVMNAPLTIKISYYYEVTTDLGLDKLCISFNNQDQIITSNRENLNVYSYFNNKYLRLIKGNNDLTLQTMGGKAKVVITCEFLRKVGGF